MHDRSRPCGTTLFRWQLSLVHVRRHPHREDRHRFGDDFSLPARPATSESAKTAGQRLLANDHHRIFLPRLAAFVALYVIAKLPAQSDMVVYLDHSRWVLNGQRPFIDFETAYGPWFLYVCSWALRIWNSAGALVLLAVIAEFAAWPLWIRLMKSLLGEQEAKLTAWIYSLAPLAFLNVPMIGLNHVWLTAFLGLALLWQHRRQQLLAGLAVEVVLGSGGQIPLAPVGAANVLELAKKDNLAAWVLLVAANSLRRARSSRR